MNIDNQADKPTVIFLLGPTASGKTALAMALQQQLPIELISVDSAMIYRGMDIGTAKPSPAELAAHPHLLIDILDPTQRYSAADFCRDAKQAIQAVIARGHIPLLVGGTMLYFKALLEGLSPLPAADLALRQQLLQQAEQQGWPALHQQLQDCDAIAAQRIHPNDPQRLIRALEVFLLTGQSLTDLTHSKGDGLPYRVIQFAIAPQDRALLHQRVELRFKQMLAQGFEQEAKALFAQYDLHSDLPSVRCVGYRQMWDYLHGMYGYDEMVFRGICATRQLAKRQMTWLRGWQALHWLQSEQMTQALRQIQQVVDATS